LHPIEKKGGADALEKTAQKRQKLGAEPFAFKAEYF
jgi:hypothetical protein